MRLINVESFIIEEFTHDFPRYVILSHTWQDGEVSYQEFHTAEARQKAGFQKIARFCQLVNEKHYQYAWVDTCCIDKTSSTELSEAINSMFRWYQNADLCIAYLSDFGWVEEEHVLPQWEASRWFTRGWTLQELLAPPSVLLYDSSWHCFGDRTSFATPIERVTGINERYLVDGEDNFEESHPTNNDKTSPRLSRIRHSTIAEKMSWAAGRQTTREEDIAYSLLGLCNVNMTLLYGEGTHAFIRLQEEIIHREFDWTLLAWGLPWAEFESRRNESLESPNKNHKRQPYPVGLLAFMMFAGDDHPWSDPVPHEATRYPSSGLLASSPRCFRDCKHVIAHHIAFDWELTSRGFRVSLPASDDTNCYMVLPCQIRDEPLYLIAIPLIKQQTGLYRRAHTGVKLVREQSVNLWPLKSLYLDTKHLLSERSQEVMWLSVAPEFSIEAVSPPEKWSPSQSILYWSKDESSRLKPLFALLIRTVKTEERFSVVVIQLKPTESSDVEIALWISPLENSSSLHKLLDINYLTTSRFPLAYPNILLYTTRTNILGFNGFCVNIEPNALDHDARQAGRQTRMVPWPFNLLRRGPWSKIGSLVAMAHTAHASTNPRVAVLLELALFVSCLSYAATYTYTYRGLPYVSEAFGSSCRFCHDHCAFSVVIGLVLYILYLTYQYLPILTYFFPTWSSTIRTHRLLLSLVATILLSSFNPTENSVLIAFCWVHYIMIWKFRPLRHISIFLSIPACIWFAIIYMDRYYVGNIFQVIRLGAHHKLSFVYPIAIGVNILWRFSDGSRDVRFLLAGLGEACLSYGFCVHWLRQWQSRLESAQQNA